MKINTKYDNQIANLGLKMENSISKAEYQLEKIEDQLTQNTSKQKELNSSIDDMSKKLQESKNEENQLLNSTEGIGKSITGVIKKVAKWTLAVFGIRSAYNAVRSAMGILSQYNQKMATDVEYIQFALATVLQPVIEGIIKLVYTLLSYVNYLAKAWFNVNLFANAGAKAFESMKKSSGETAKNAKNIEKSTAGFDDLNILEDNSSTNNVNNNDSSIAPSFDLSNIENIEPPKWLETIKEFGTWIIEHWPVVLGVLGLTGAVLLGMKLSKWVKSLKESKNGVTELGGTFKGFFDGLGKGIEAIAILGGLALVIQSITSLIDTFAQSGLSLTDVIGLMSTIFIALIGLIATLTISAKALQSPLAMGGLVLVVGSFVAILFTLKETLPTILDAGAKFINDIGPFVITLIETINNGIDVLIHSLGDVLPPIITSIGDLFNGIFNGIAKIIETVGNVIINIMNTAKSLIVTVLQAILNFINQLGPAINNFVDGAILAITKLINFVISGIEYMVNTLIIDAINGLISAVNEIPLVDVPTLPRVNIPRFQPILMAGGGIIDVPRKGVPLANNVIGGEAGSEGVLPLENPDTMARLGQEIGKWISINVDLTNTIDGRVLNRRLEEIKNDNHFARNGGF